MTITKKDLLLHKPDIKKCKASGFRVLIRPEQEEIKAAKREVSGDVVLHESGLYIPKEKHEDDLWNEKQKILMQNSGTVLSIGPTAWRGFDEGKKWCKVGDRVYFRRYQGEDFEASDGKIYKIINDEDIYLIETEV